MPRGTVVPFIPDLPAGDDDKRPRDPPDRPGWGALPHLIELHRLDRLQELAERTQASYRQTYKLLDALRDHPSVAQVKRWVTLLRAEYPPPPGCRDSWTVWVHWHNLAALYAWAQRSGHVCGANPAACAQVKKPQPRARAIIDLADMWPAIIGVCRDLRERAFLQVGRDTGIRIGEALGLMPHDLNALGEPWRLHVERQRADANRFATSNLKINGGVRDLTVTAELRAMLVELLTQGAPRIWVGKGRRKLMESRFLFPYRKHEVMDLRRRAGAVAPGAFPPGDWYHALRHTLAYELNHSGASVEEVQRQLGHTSPQTTAEVYINVIGRPVDAAPMARVEAARRAGVVKWGSPPGKGVGPPVAREATSGPQKRTAGASTPAVQERSKSGPTITKESTSCRTPSREQRRPGPQSSSSSETSQTTRTRSPRSSSGRASGPGRSTPASRSPRPSGQQRALPGLAVQRVTTRPPRPRR